MLSSSFGRVWGKHYENIIVPIFRFVLQNFALPGCFPCILCYPIISLYFVLIGLLLQLMALTCALIVWVHFNHFFLKLTVACRLGGGGWGWGCGGVGWGVMISMYRLWLLNLLGLHWPNFGCLKKAVKLNHALIHSSPLIAALDFTPLILNTRWGTCIFWCLVCFDLVWFDQQFTVGMCILFAHIIRHWGRDKMAAISQSTFLNGFFFNENGCISINISLKFVPKGQINNIPALLQIFAWHRPGDKPLSETMMA